MSTVAIEPAGLTPFAAHYDNLDALPMWVVTFNSSDRPGCYAARLHMTLPEHVVTNAVIVGQTLDDVRAALPEGLTCLARAADDDPVIVEVWL